MRALKEDCEAIYRAAIEAVNPAAAVKNHLAVDGNRLVLGTKEKKIAELDLGSIKNIYVVGSGKATSPMALAVEEILAARITGGCLCVKYGYTEKLARIETVEAAHPIPDDNGVRGARKIVSILDGAGKDDLVISLISGGGSALLPLPPETISLEEKGNTTKLLLNCGASIHEINTVRKHLSLVKGGNMARAAYPARVINFMISDVVGDDMDVIASGPFVPDNSTYSMALDILDAYKLTNTVPASVLKHLRDGKAGRIDENPDARSPVFERITNSIIASNILALKAALKEAQKRGYNSLILSSSVQGDTAETARWHACILHEIVRSSHPVPAPACIISGGETTVRVTGTGTGGRNMEFAMQAAPLINGIKNVLMASIGTDGTDGPTDAAGALVTGSTVDEAVRKNVHIGEYSNNNDSYNFFKQAGGLIITGPTNTNVMDVRILLVSGK